MGHVLSTQIGDTFERKLKSDLGAQQKRFQASQEPAKFNISQAGEKFRGQREGLFTQNLQDQRALRERFANLGASRTGGSSQVAESKLGQRFRSDLTGSRLEQQSFIGEQNRALAQGAALNEATIADITSQGQLAKQQALAQQDQQTIQLYLSMFLNGSITREKFRELTGLEV
jgi:hypothetical protein